MLKLKISWELEDGSKFEEWTRPIELAAAEREVFNGRSVIAVLRDDSAPSNHFMLYLAHKIHQRISDKQLAILTFGLKKLLRLGCLNLISQKVQLRKHNSNGYSFSHSNRSCSSILVRGC
jgi:hypothetical protein